MRRDSKPGNLGTRGEEEKTNYLVLQLASRDDHPCEYRSLPSQTYQRTSEDPEEMGSQGVREQFQSRHNSVGNNTKTLVNIARIQHPQSLAVFHSDTCP